MMLTIHQISANVTESMKGRYPCNGLIMAFSGGIHTPFEPARSRPGADDLCSHLVLVIDGSGSSAPR